jgi:hypothetical protein
MDTVTFRFPPEYKLYSIINFIMKILSDTPESTVSLDESSVMHITWKNKSLTGEIFKENVILFAKQASLCRPVAILVDARSHDYVVTSQIQAWHDENIIPQYLSAGVKALAFINPEKLFSELTTRRIFEQKKAKNGLSVAFFKEPDQAMQWLMA